MLNEIPRLSAPARPHARASSSLAHPLETTSHRSATTVASWQAANARLADAAQRAGLDTLADRLRGCGRGLWAWAATDGGYAPAVDLATGQQVRFLASCRHRLCLRCVAARSRKLAGRLLAVIDAEFAAEPMLVTLTREAQAGESPADAADAVAAAFVRLRRLKVWRAAVRGGFSTVHFAGESGRHAHVHVVVDADWLDQDALLEAWQRCLSAADRTGRPVCGGARVERARSAAAAVRYVLKGHGAEVFADADLPTILSWMQGRRLVQTFGSLYGQTVADPQPVVVAVSERIARRRPRPECVNAATGEAVPSIALIWQGSELAHRMGYALCRTPPTGPVPLRSRLPDHDDAGAGGQLGWAASQR